MISNIVNRIIAFFRSDTGKRLSKWLHRLFLLGVWVWLIWQLTNIGWLKVWKSLPTHPLFYILFLLIYFSLPLVEIFIYKLTFYLLDVWSEIMFWFLFFTTMYWWFGNVSSGSNELFV